MISHLQMITIYVSDMEQARKFYTEQLGFVEKAQFRDEENYFVWVLPATASDQKQATLIGLFEPRDKHDPRIGKADGLVFTAEDIEATYTELKARGVPFVLELIRHPYGAGAGDQEARFTDPDGNLFLLHT